jgi:hypothetical protein
MGYGVNFREELNKTLIHIKKKELIASRASMRFDPLFLP